METNTATATIYTVPEIDRPDGEEAEKISIWDLPKILWAGLILFVVNLVIATGIAASPELNVDIRGETAGAAIAAKSKPSAFATLKPQKPRAVRAPVKLQPVLEIAPSLRIEP